MEEHVITEIDRLLIGCGFQQTLSRKGPQVEGTDVKGIRVVHYRLTGLRGFSLELVISSYSDQSAAAADVVKALSLVPYVVYPEGYRIPFKVLFLTRDDYSESSLAECIMAPAYQLLNLANPFIKCMGQQTILAKIIEHLSIREVVKLESTCVPARRVLLSQSVEDGYWKFKYIDRFGERAAGSPNVSYRELYMANMRKEYAPFPAIQPDFCSDDRGRPWPKFSPCFPPDPTQPSPSNPYFPNPLLPNPTQPKNHWPPPYNRPELYPDITKGGRRNPFGIVGDPPGSFPDYKPTGRGAGRGGSDGFFGGRNGPFGGIF